MSRVNDQKTFIRFLRFWGYVLGAEAISHTANLKFKDSNIYFDFKRVYENVLAAAYRHGWEYEATIAAATWGLTLGMPVRIESIPVTITVECKD